MSKGPSKKEQEMLAAADVLMHQAGEVVEVVETLQFLNRERFREEWGEENWNEGAIVEFERLRELLGEMQETLKKLP